MCSNKGNCQLSQNVLIRNDTGIENWLPAIEHVYNLSADQLQPSRTIKIIIITAMIQNGNNDHSENTGSSQVSSAETSAQSNGLRQKAVTVFGDSMQRLKKEQAPSIASRIMKALASMSGWRIMTRSIL